MKLAIWTPSPSPHQSDFHAALRDAGVDLQVRYFGRLRASRQALGWRDSSELPEGESVVTEGEDPLNSVSDVSERVHVVPGYAYGVSRRVYQSLAAEGVPWVHWSEPSSGTLRAKILAPRRWRYASIVNEHALGAFAQGAMAAECFVRWGIRRESIAHLFYSSRFTEPVAPSRRVTDWLAGRRAFVFIGALIPRKRPLALIKAFATAARNQADTALVIVGDGPLRRACEVEAHRRGVADRVLMLGAVPIDETPACLAACSVLVLPSSFDGWGMVVNEAASAGLALLASDAVGSGRHLISPGENGCLFRAQGSATLAAAMAPYIADADLARRHGIRSREIATDFTPESNARRLRSAIRTWLAGKPRWKSWSKDWETASLTTHTVSAANSAA